MPDTHFLDSIYESAFMPECWTKVLGHLADEVSGWGAGLIVVNDDKSARILPSNSYSALVALLNDKLGGKFENPRPARHLARDHAGFLSDLDLSTREELAVDPIYTSVMYPLGMGWSAGTTIPTPTGDMLVFDVVRKTSVGPFTRASLRRLDYFRPHLARAALMTARLGLERARLAAEILETVGMAAAVVSRVGKVLAINRLFESLSPRVSTRAADRLWVSDANARQAFEDTMGRVGALGSGSARSIPIPGDGHLPASILHVLPVRRSAYDIFTGAAAFAVVTPLAAASAPSAAVLSGLFDLSPAEARVAKGVASGKSLSEIAASLGLSVSTVRSYLKAVFAKTGVRRQAQLVSLLSNARAIA